MRRIGRVSAEWAHAADDAMTAATAESRRVPVAVPERRESIAIGKKLPGGYVLRALLGEGGTSRVYLAEQLSLGRSVAIKMLYSGVPGREARARLRVEASAMSTVRHPGSVMVYDLLERDDGMPFLVMEHVAGQPMTAEPLPLRRHVARVVQLLATLEEVHASGVIHRDVKPDNVMIRCPGDRSREHVTIIDYGLALVRQGKRVEGVQERGVAYGTVGYMSPEQLEGDVVDTRTDVYSAAVLLRTLLVRALEPSSALPPRLVAAMERALEGDRTRRTPSAAQFAFELEEAMSHE